MKKYTAPIYNELDPETSEFVSRCPGSSGKSYIPGGIAGVDYAEVALGDEGNCEVTIGVDNFTPPSDWVLIP